MRADIVELPKEAVKLYEGKTHSLFCDGRQHYLKTPATKDNSAFDVGSCWCKQKNKVKISAL